MEYLFFNQKEIKKFERKFFVFLAIVIFGIATIQMCGCTPFVSNSKKSVNEVQKTTSSQNLFNQDESIYQVSLLQSLMLGDYYGSISVGDLKTMGDTGLGTFESMNGEMIVLDGVVYQALSDGSVIIPKDDVMIPFSNITTFNADDSFEINNKMSLENLQKIFDEKVVKNGQNSFYMIKLKGDFPFMKVRSIFSQKVPYKPLMEVIKTDQVVFDYENVKGTIVALYCPSYMDKLNMTGWHYHFLSEDKSKGGHILDFTISNGKAELDLTTEFKMILPKSNSFQQLNLSNDLKEEIEAVEKN